VGGVLMGENKKLPVITKETIEKHIKDIEKAKKMGSFKSKSNKIFKDILEENPELVNVSGVTLESDKSEDYKAGYLAAFVTIYDLLRRQIKSG
jgi:hypothetical protein